MRLRASFGSAEEGARGEPERARTSVAADLAEDIAWCARESIFDVVPAVVGMHGGAPSSSSRVEGPDLIRPVSSDLRRQSSST